MKNVRREHVLDPTEDLVHENLHMFNCELLLFGLDQLSQISVHQIGHNVHIFEFFVRSRGNEINEGNDLCDVREHVMLDSCHPTQEICCQTYILMVEMPHDFDLTENALLKLPVVAKHIEHLLDCNTCATIPIFTRTK